MMLNKRKNSVSGGISKLFQVSFKKNYVRKILETVCDQDTKFTWTLDKRYV